MAIKSVLAFLTAHAGEDLTHVVNAASSSFLQLESAEHLASNLLQVGSKMDDPKKLIAPETEVKAPKKKVEMVLDIADDCPVVDLRGQQTYTQLGGGIESFVWRYQDFAVKVHVKAAEAQKEYDFLMKMQDLPSTIRVLGLCRVKQIQSLGDKDMLAIILPVVERPLGQDRGEFRENVEQEKLRPIKLKAGFEFLVGCVQKKMFMLDHDINTLHNVFTDDDGMPTYYDISEQGVGTEITFTNLARTRGVLPTARTTDRLVPLALNGQAMTNGLEEFRTLALTLTMWKQARALSLEEILPLSKFVKLRTENFIEKAFRESIGAYLKGSGRVNTGIRAVDTLFTQAEKLLAAVETVNKCAKQHKDCGNVNSDDIKLAQKLQG